MRIWSKIWSKIHTSTNGLRRSTQMQPKTTALVFLCSCVTAFLCFVYVSKNFFWMRPLRDSQIMFEMAFEFLDLGGLADFLWHCFVRLVHPLFTHAMPSSARTLSHPLAESTGFHTNQRRAYKCIMKFNR